MKPRPEGSDIYTTPSVNDVLALCGKLRERAEAALKFLPGTEDQRTTRRFLSEICSNLPDTEDGIPHAFYEMRCLLIGGKEREDSVLIRIGSNSSSEVASSSKLNPDLDLSNGAYKFRFIPKPGAGGKNAEWEVSEELLEKLRSGELRREESNTEENEAETEQRATVKTTTEIGNVVDTGSQPNDEQEKLEDEAEAEEVEQVVRRKHNGAVSSDSSFSSTNDSSIDIAARRVDKGKQRAIWASSSLASVGEGSSTVVAAPVRQYASIGVQTNAEGVVPTSNTTVEEGDDEYLALVASDDEDDDAPDAPDALIALANPLAPAPVPVAALPPPPHIHRPLRRENAMYFEPWPEPPAAGPVAVVAAQAAPAAAVAPAADIVPAPAAPVMALAVVPVVPAMVEAAPPPPAAAPAPTNHVPLEIVDGEELQQIAGPSTLPNNAVASGSRRKQIEAAPAQPDTRRRSSRLSKRSTSNASAEASGSNVASGSGSRTRRKNNGKGKASDESLAPAVVVESSKAAGKRRRVEETIEEKDEEEAEGEGSAAPVASPKKRTRREAVAEPTKPPTRPRRNATRRK